MGRTYVPSAIAHWRHEARPVSRAYFVCSRKIDPESLWWLEAVCWDGQRRKATMGDVSVWAFVGGWSDRTTDFACMNPLDAVKLENSANPYPLNCPVILSLTIVTLSTLAPRSARKYRSSCAAWVPKS